MTGHRNVGLLVFLKDDRLILFADTCASILDDKLDHGSSTLALLDLFVVDVVDIFLNKHCLRGDPTFMREFHSIL